MYYFEAMVLCFKFIRMVLTILVLMFSVACARKTQVQGTDILVKAPVDKIVGGQELQSSRLVNHRFVMIVSDNQGTPQICTGTVISQHHILTAAHCVNNSIDDLSLVTGVKPLGNEQALVLTPVAVYRHEKYNEASVMDRNDVAIIKIAETIKLKNSEMPKLPDGDVIRLLEKSDRTQFLAVGYGMTGSVGNEDRTEGVLRSVYLEIKSKSEKTLLVDQTQGRGVCYGDSGGPALKKYQQKIYIIGIASGIYSTDASSLNEDECQAGALYMNIIPYIPWIRSVMNESLL